MPLVLEDSAITQTAIKEQLSSVCWNFSNSQSRNTLHTIHPYPAKFIPDIPRTLIDLFHPGDSSPVLDPFCGSGTSLVEAKAVGKPAVGIDLNPLSALISKVKTTSIRGDIRSNAAMVIEIAKQNMNSGQMVIPNIPNLDHWFKHEVQCALATLIDAVKTVGEEDLRDALNIAISSIIVRVSNQDSDTRYAAVIRNIDAEGVWNSFERAANNLARACEDENINRCTPEQPVRVINKDLMLVEPDEIGRGIGLVVTSPPYPNAYEYWLYHKYRMYWLGMDPIRVREREIGARPHYFKKNHQTEHDFERQMNRCFWLLSKVMNHGTFACFVVGRSIIHGREIDNEALLERAAVPNGFRLMGVAPREIARSRKSFNLHHAKICREGVMVFRLETK